MFAHHHAALKNIFTFNKDVVINELDLLNLKFKILGLRFIVLLNSESKSSNFESFSIRVWIEYKGRFLYELEGSDRDIEPHPLPFAFLLEAEAGFELGFLYQVDCAH